MRLISINWLYTVAISKKRIGLVIKSELTAVIKKVLKNFEILSSEFSTFQSKPLSGIMFKENCIEL